MGWASILWPLISLPVAKTSQVLSEALGVSGTIGVDCYKTLRYDIFGYNLNESWWSEWWTLHSIMDRTSLTGGNHYPFHVDMSQRSCESKQRCEGTKSETTLPVGGARTDSNCEAEFWHSDLEKQKFREALDDKLNVRTRLLSSESRTKCKMSWGLSTFGFIERFYKLMLSRRGLVRLCVHRQPHVMECFLYLCCKKCRLLALEILEVWFWRSSHPPWSQENSAPQGRHRDFLYWQSLGQLPMQQTKGLLQRSIRPTDLEPPSLQLRQPSTFRIMESARPQNQLSSKLLLLPSTVPWLIRIEQLLTFSHEVLKYPIHINLLNIEYKWI